jgi:hypothetical protein
LVIRLSQPPALALSLACLPAIRLRAILLVSAIAPVWDKRLLAAEAVVRVNGASHGAARKPSVEESGISQIGLRNTLARRRAKKEEDLVRRRAGRRRRQKKTRFSDRRNHTESGMAFTSC